MPDPFRAAERLMGMSDAVWARHANPWSVWTRIATPLPLFALAVWSRIWIGPWALAGVALVVVWVWLNPRLFPAPARLEGWASEGVLGERVFLRQRTRIAAHHLRAASILTALSVLGALPYAWGLWRLDTGMVLAGMLLIAGAKLWFVDRMVWVWADFRRAGGTQADLASR